MACMDWRSQCRNCETAIVQVLGTTSISVTRDATYLENDLIQLYHCHWRAETFCGAIAEDQFMCLVHLFQLVLIVYQPSFRTKVFWILSKDLVELRTPRIEANESATRYTITVDDVSHGGYYTFPELTYRGELA